MTPLSKTPRLLLVPSENWTMTSPRDLRALVRIAAEAEQAGIDGVMLSEHIVLGPAAGAAGVMANPREYAVPGNQPPDMAWPSSVVLPAIAAAAERLRLVAGAVIAPLRHPLLLAKELGTLDLLSEGRLVVIPTVSWHQDEYAALGVPFRQRGAILDEQLDVLARGWQPGPVSYHGKRYSFDEVWLAPGPFRPDGPPQHRGRRRGRLHRRVHHRQRLRPARLPGHRRRVDAPVKGADTLCPLGPGLVSGWDFPGKSLRTYVNGRLAQDGSTDEMAWDMHYLVADIARLITLLPGDVLLSGTPANSRPVWPGDVVEVEAEGLGRLVNHIVEGPAGVRGDVGAQPTESEEVRSTALGGDWEFRGLRPPRRS